MREIREGAKGRKYTGGVYQICLGQRDGPEMGRGEARNTKKEKSSHREQIVFIVIKSDLFEVLFVFVLLFSPLFFLSLSFSRVCADGII